MITNKDNQKYVHKSGIVADSLFDILDKLLITKVDEEDLGMVHVSESDVYRFVIRFTNKVLKENT